MKKIEGFLVKMIDGSEWLIPICACVERDVQRMKEFHDESEDGPYNIEQERIQSMKRLAGMWHSADVEDFFAGAEWSEFENHAILKTPADESPQSAMWRDAKIEGVGP